VLIKKSRFIGCVQPVADRAAAQQVVAALRSQHPAAAHVCWALLGNEHQQPEPGCRWSGACSHCYLFDSFLHNKYLGYGLEMHTTLCLVISFDI